MNTTPSPLCLVFVIQWLMPLLFLATPCHASSTDDSSCIRQVPRIEFLWPASRPFVFTGNSFTVGTGTWFKLKVESFYPEGTLNEVRFFAGADLIGRVASAPYAIVWIVPVGHREISAIAVDRDGKEVVVRAGVVNGASGRPADRYVNIVRPAAGAILAAPATFEVAAELFASGIENGSIELLVDGLPAGQVSWQHTLEATTPPAIFQVTNLLEGSHVLGVRYLSGQCNTCPAVTNYIRVVRLGVHSPKVCPNGTRQFEVATSYGDKLHVIEASPDLVDWCTIAVTNAPATNSFTFVVPACARPEDRYYRVVVPSP